MDRDIRQFLIDTLKDMNYDVTDVTGDTVLGPEGIDLESLAVAELAVLVEDEFRVAFTEKDTETLARLTIDEFAAEITRRLADVRAGAPS